MGKRIKSSDVIDANVVTKKDLRGEVIGRFEPTGPNRWDDHELVREETGEVVEVPPANPIQLEPLGADPELRFRYRQGRTVLLLRWQPTDEDRDALSTGQWGVRESEQATFFEKVFGTGPKDDPRDDMLEYFLDQLVDPHDPEPGIGYEAMLVQKLRGR